MRRLILHSTLVVSGLLCASCTNPEREPSVGEAYVGPATMTLRQELAPKSPVSATVRHGDHLEILATRRRFVKVRTSDDKPGWVDGYQLLTPQQMADLKDLAIHAQKLPSQGSATVYDVLNMHTEPSRQAPSFYQIQEKGIVEVVGHKIAERGIAATIPAVAASIKTAPVTKRRGVKPINTKRLGPPPLPDPPRPPKNWIELSKGSTSAKKEPVALPTAPPVAPSPSKPKPPGPKPQLTDAERALILEDWSLVRTRDGRVGWVLSRPLVMSIPDEVAQYAEGHRITAYVSLGENRDRDGELISKQNWLWGTAQNAVMTNEYDTVRAFTYNQRRHRYETAFLDKNIKGFYPMTATPDPDGGIKFAYIVQDDDRFYRKTYSFNGHNARLISRESFQLPDLKPPQNEPLSVALVQQQSQSWYQKTKDAVGTQWRKWFR